MSSLRFSMLVALVLAGCRSSAPAPLQKAEPPADPADFSDLYEPDPAEPAAPRSRAEERIDRVSDFLRRELESTAEQDDSVRSVLELDAFRRALRSRAHQANDPDAPEPATPREKKKTDTHPALARLDDASLVSILHLLDPSQVDRYVELVGNDGVRRIRALVQRRLDARGELGEKAVAFDKGLSGLDRSFWIKWDRNGNGKIDRNEVPRHMREDFDALDVNGDGALDAFELMGYHDYMDYRADDAARESMRGRLWGRAGGFTQPLR